MLRGLFFFVRHPNIVKQPGQPSDVFSIRLWAQYRRRWDCQSPSRRRAVRALSLGETTRRHPCHCICEFSRHVSPHRRLRCSCVRQWVWQCPLSRQCWTLRKIHHRCERQVSDQNRTRASNQHLRLNAQASSRRVVRQYFHRIFLAALQAC